MNKHIDASLTMQLAPNKSLRGHKVSMSHVFLCLNIACAYKDSDIFIP